MFRIYLPASPDPGRRILLRMIKLIPVSKDMTRILHIFSLFLYDMTNIEENDIDEGFRKREFIMGFFGRQVQLNRLPGDDDA